MAQTSADSDGTAVVTASGSGTGRKQRVTLRVIFEGSMTKRWKVKVDIGLCIMIICTAKGYGYRRNMGK